MKDTEQYEIYEKANKRIKEKKRLYFHFVLFLIGSVILVILNKVVNVGGSKSDQDWFVWAICIWFVVLLIHFINVFFMNRFFGKEWIRIQTEKLVEKHQLEVEKLEESLDKKGSFTTNKSEEDTNP